MNSMKTYEAMFLVEATGADFEALSEPVRTILERNGVEVLSLRAWDERKLAFEIGKAKRGLYILGYLKVDPQKISEIEHDCQLNEQILRVLLLAREGLTDEEVHRPTPAMTGQRAPEGRPEPDEGPRGRRDRFGDRDRDRDRDRGRDERRDGDRPARAEEAPRRQPSDGEASDDFASQ